MIINPSKAKGVFVSPPSKSIAHRYLICAALADGKSVINNVAFSEDIKATLECIKQIGAEVVVEENKITVKGNPKALFLNEGNPKTFNCNESGSTLRFFIPLSMLNNIPSRFAGSKVLMTRPLSVYEEICRKQNISFEQKNGVLETCGKLNPGVFNIPGNISSQFITGLLFALPLLDGNSEINLTESIESKSYIELTIEALKDFGIDVQWKNGNTLLIPGKQSYKPKDIIVEGDYSNAAFFEALNLLGGKVEIKGLRDNSLQGDRICFDYFKKIKSGYTSIDISDCPDLGPVLFVAAACFKGAEFIGTRRLKIKESNRGTVMCEELSKFGVKSLQEENRIIIYESNLKKPEQLVCGHNDHRVVMSLAVLMTVTGGKLDGVLAVKKSFPDFFRKLKELEIDFKFDAEGESDGLDN